jgi:hypothetical protein
MHNSISQRPWSYSPVSLKRIPTEVCLYFALIVVLTYLSDEKLVSISAAVMQACVITALTHITYFADLSQENNKLILSS